MPKQKTKRQTAPRKFMYIVDGKDRRQLDSLVERIIESDREYARNVGIRMRQTVSGAYISKIEKLLKRNRSYEM